MRKRSIEPQSLADFPDYPDRVIRRSGASPSAHEVSMRELDRHTCRVIDLVSEERDVVVVSRYGLPVAMILPLDDAVSLLPPSYVMGGELGELSQRFVRRASARSEARLAHGRWYPGAG
jgi:antitoxin (DNA-binding transcriptional repressor) of toxin-antitoxin stability system